jgi:hypothetical protein
MILISVTIKLPDRKLKELEEYLLLHVGKLNPELYQAWLARLVKPSDENIHVWQSVDTKFPLMPMGCPCSQCILSNTHLDSAQYCNEN